MKGLMEGMQKIVLVGKNTTDKKDMAVAGGNVKSIKAIEPRSRKFLIVVTHICYDASCDVCDNEPDFYIPEEWFLLSADKVAKRWESIVRDCRSQRERFTDDEFIPGPRSLYLESSRRGEKNIPTWKRINEMNPVNDDCYDLPWTIFRGTPQVTDVMQGKLGNCWFMAALASLAEREELVRSLIITPDICPESVYQVRLCIDGGWTTVLVDDYFPCKTSSSAFFSKPMRKQIWPLLIEKAAAKIHGCYEALIGGWGSEGISTLTGYPVEVLQLQSPHISVELNTDDVWEKLLFAKKSLFIMVALPAAQMVEVMFRKKGLPQPHAYSLLDVAEVDGLRLVILRDSSGRSQWNGARPDMSPLVAAYLKKMTPDAPKSGSFWMPFDDFLIYFYEVTIGKIRTGWNEIRLNRIQPWETYDDCRSCIIVSVPESTEVDFTLYQEGKRRGFDLQLSIEIFKKPPPDTLIEELIRHTMGQICTVFSVTEYLEAGEYVILPKIFNLDVTEERLLPYFKFAVHSAKPIEAKHMSAWEFHSTNTAKATVVTNKNL